MTTTFPLDGISGAATLLVACDFDGTLAPIVDDPDAATALPAAVAALRRLAGMPATTVAIVSGRRRDELVERFGDGLVLIGEHGADAGVGSPPEPEVLTRARGLVEEARAEAPGSRVEHKPRSVVFHFRLVEDPQAVVARLRSRAESLEGITAMEGKSVVELTTSTVDKGDAVDRLRQKTGADAVIFVGDDVTDEAVFSRLDAADLGVKVGPGPTSAAFRVDGPEDVAELLETLADRRGG